MDCPVHGQIIGFPCPLCQARRPKLRANEARAVPVEARIHRAEYEQVPTGFRRRRHIEASPDDEDTNDPAQRPRVPELDHIWKGES